MGDKSAIEWTDATWNPVTGCTKVSPACANCYIETTPPFRIAGRRFIRGHIPLQFHEDRLTQPLRWKRPRRIFVNSLSDLFHPDVPAEFIGRVFNVMGWAHQHTFQVLTKRPERMREVVTAYYETLGRKTVLDNVWLGVSVENQHFADLRIPLLLQTPAAVRFISAEPLLGELDLRNERAVGHDYDWLTGENYEWADGTPCALPLLPRLDWVIGGFESGRRRRDGDVDHARVLRDQCKVAGVAFMWKQNGGLTSKSGGRLLDGEIHDGYPDVRAHVR